MNEFEHDVIDRLGRIEERLANVLAATSKLESRVTCLEKNGHNMYRRWFLLGILIASIAGGSVGANIIEYVLKALR